MKLTQRYRESAQSSKWDAARTTILLLVAVAAFGAAGLRWGFGRYEAPPALVLGFARLPEYRTAEAVRLLAEAAAATRAGRAH